MPEGGLRDPCNRRPSPCVEAHAPDGRWPHRGPERKTRGQLFRPTSRPPSVARARNTPFQTANLRGFLHCWSRSAWRCDRPSQKFFPFEVRDLTHVVTEIVTCVMDRDAV